MGGDQEDGDLVLGPLSPSDPFRSGGSASKSRIKKERRDRREPKKPKTQSAPKRGEYRCGKCGFFPKKSKHDCTQERRRLSLGDLSKSLNDEDVLDASDATMTSPSEDAAAQAAKFVGISWH